MSSAEAESADLTTRERAALHAALVSAFYDGDQLDTLLYNGEGLGVSLASITAPGPLDSMVTKVIRWAERNGKTHALIEAAHAGGSDNALLHRFYGTYSGSAQRQVTRDTLEKITSSAVLFKEPGRWRDLMARRESCVCCIVIGGARQGSGFLAAPGVVMTNYHVVRDADWKSIQVEFDYQAAADGSLTPSRYYRVSGPLIASSPYHNVDSRHPKPPAPPPDDTALDYALLPIDGKPEEARMSDGRPRGVIPPPAPVPRLVEGMPLLILQHPKKPDKNLEGPDLHPLRFAFDEVTEVNENASRVRYRVNSEPGSSGSPCFDADWNLVALHHSGDPREIEPAEYNEGIPIATIRRTLQDGVREQLGWAREQPYRVDPGKPVTEIEIPPDTDVIETPPETATPSDHTPKEHGRNWKALIVIGCVILAAALLYAFADSSTKATFADADDKAIYLDVKNNGWKRSHVSRSELKFAEPNLIEDATIGPLRAVIAAIPARGEERVQLEVFGLVARRDETRGTPFTSEEIAAWLRTTKAQVSIVIQESDGPPRRDTVDVDGESLQLLVAEKLITRRPF